MLDTVQNDRAVNFTIIDHSMVKLNLSLGGRAWNRSGCPLTDKSVSWERVGGRRRSPGGATLWRYKKGEIASNGSAHGDAALVDPSRAKLQV